MNTHTHSHTHTHTQQGEELVEDNRKDAALLARLKAQLHRLNIEQQHLADTKGLVN
jgi:hypothetical protein